MNITIKPSKLSGSLVAMPSVAEAHRKLICAAFSCGTVRNVPFTEDVCATLGALKEIGASYDVVNDSVIFRSLRPNNRPSINCGESLQTLIYFMCIVCALHDDVEATFDGSDKLPMDCVRTLTNVLKLHGIRSDFDGKFPFTLRGSLGSGEYAVPCEYADEIVSGLMLGLNMNETDSLIAVSGSDYPHSGIELTFDVLKESKIMTAYASDVFIVRGGQSFRLADTSIGGDFSLASSFVVANAMNSNVRVLGLDAMSAQPEKVLFDILRNIQASGCKGFDIDCAEIPKLVPILAVYACSLHGTSCLRNINGRSYEDSVDSDLICNMINSVGGKATALSDRVVIDGVKSLSGGTVDCKFEHRIVYAASILSTICTGNVIIENVECVTKPYASFFDEFRRVGGNAVISVD